MKQKNTGIKIKRRKYNLYNRKKSKGKQALALVMTIFAAAALCVLGYGLGKPIVEYFQNKDQLTSDDSSAWTPPVSTEDTGAPGGAETLTTKETEQTTAPGEDKEENYFMLPDGAALSSEGLKSAVAAAKNKGATAVVVTLKDEDGNFLYKSGIDGIKDSGAIKGSLNARQIFGIINSAELAPIARIGTLKDHTSYKYIDNMHFTTAGGWVWLDNFADQGGKSWLSPMLPKTVSFFEEITSELSAAGFKTILLADVMFPPFRAYDYTLVGDLSDSEQRLEALWGFIDAIKAAAEKNGAEIRLEMDSAALLSERTATNAEPAGDKDKLLTVPILAEYTADPSDHSAYITAKSFIGMMNNIYKGQEYCVLIKGGGFSQTMLDTIKKAFTEAGITVYTG